MDPKSPMSTKSPEQVTSDVRELAAQIAQGEIGRARKWGGAGVVIERRAPEPSPPDFYPDPTCVVTRHVAELSWLFQQLLHIFGKLNEDMFAWKHDFFTQLANAANDAIDAGRADSAMELLLAVCDVAATLPTHYA